MNGEIVQELLNAVREERLELKPGPVHTLVQPHHLVLHQRRVQGLHHALALTAVAVAQPVQEAFGAEVAVHSPGARQEEGVEQLARPLRRADTQIQNQVPGHHPYPTGERSCQPGQMM